MIHIKREWARAGLMKGGRVEKGPLKNVPRSTLLVLVQRGRKCDNNKTKKNHARHGAAVRDGRELAGGRTGRYSLLLGLRCLG